MGVIVPFAVSVPTAFTQPSRTMLALVSSTNEVSRLGRRGSSSGNELERLDMEGSDDREVPVIKSGDLSDSQSLGYCDHNGIDGSQPKICVALDEVGSPLEVNLLEGCEGKGAHCQVAQETSLGHCPKPPSDEVRGLCNHELGHDEGRRTFFEQGTAALMVGVRPDGCCDQRPGVDDDYCPNPSSSPSSSWRSASATLGPVQESNIPMNANRRPLLG